MFFPNHEARKNNVGYFPVTDENTQFIMDICMKIGKCHYYVVGTNTSNNNNNDNCVFNSITHVCAV